MELIVCNTAKSGGVSVRPIQKWKTKSIRFARPSSRKRDAVGKHVMTEKKFPPRKSPGIRRFFKKVSVRSVLSAVSHELLGKSRAAVACGTNGVVNSFC